MKITIKQFHTSEEKTIAKAYAKKAGLKEFNSMSFQFGMIPEGEYEIDESHIFDDQYNTKDTEKGKGFRVFEYSEALTNPTGGASPRPLGYGYYIASGIEEIRALQKQIKVCCYCGEQYKNTNLVWCTSCRGSEYLQPDKFKLLKLIPVLDKWKSNFDDIVVPDDVIEDIAKQQKATRQRLLLKRNADKIASINAEIEASKKELSGFQWLIDHDINFENCIYYTHTDQFSFGWRNPLTELEQEEIYKKMNGFPYSWEIKEKGE